ncbi:MAG: hypothetical protein ACRCTZ_01435 [Sarcina sp.]
MKNILKTLWKILIVILFFCSIFSTFKGIFTNNISFILYGIICTLFSGSLALKDIFLKQSKIIDAIFFISLAIIIISDFLSLFGIRFFH